MTRQIQYIIKSFFLQIPFILLSLQQFFSIMSQSALILKGQKSICLIFIMKIYVIMFAIEFVNRIIRQILNDSQIQQPLRQIFILRRLGLNTDQTKYHLSGFSEKNWFFIYFQIHLQYLIKNANHLQREQFF
ncbi:hypothetical protein pb186bvf_007533 [Paramecium bursaria]